MTVPEDPILTRRRRVARLAALGQRIGYGLFAAAIVLFAVGLVGQYTDGLVTAIVVALLVGSVVLAPAIVLSYAVRAADREDRRAGG